MFLPPQPQIPSLSRFGYFFIPIKKRRKNGGILKTIKIYYNIDKK